MATWYRDRNDAGVALAKLLKNRMGPGTLLICIPRGGAVICSEISKEFGVGMDVITPRKIPAPSNPELAIGAVVFDGTVWLDEKIVSELGVPDGYITDQVEKQKNESARRYSLFRRSAAEPNLVGKNVILVDDGIATGATVFAAVLWLQKKKPGTIIVSVPVSSRSAEQKLRELGVEVVCPEVADYMGAVGEFYENFDQVSDEEVIGLMDKYAKLN